MVCCFYQKFKGKIAELIFPVKAVLQPSKHRDKTVSAKLEEHGIRNQCAKISVLEIQLDWGVKLAVIRLFFWSLSIFLVFDSICLLV